MLNSIQNIDANIIYQNNIIFIKYSMLTILKSSSWRSFT